MKIREMHIQNQKKFRNGVTIDFLDPIKQKIRDRTVIVGKNGSGKTTLLQSIYSAMKLLESGGESIEEVEGDIFSPSQCRVLLQQAGDQDVIEVRTGSIPLPLDSVSEEPIVYIERSKIPVFAITGVSAHLDPYINHFVAEHPLAKEFLKNIRNAIAGVDENPQIGNVIYFPTDRLTHFSNQDESGKLVNERPEFTWAYKYNQHYDKWEGSLESYLCWLHFRDLKLKQTNFDQFKSLVNQFLEGKKITDIGLDYRVKVEDHSGGTFGLQALSSGEKQIVLLVGEILRHIHRGSIILIDEPELHLHPVWQRRLVDALTRVCQQYDAQLIIATQSPKIAEFVNRREIVELDDLLEESGS